MSSRERTLAIVLTAKSKRDLADIFRFTAQTWGLAQMELYRQHLEQALELLSRHPDAGRPAPELSLTHRVYPVKAHLIVYRRLDDKVVVLRVLHQRMGPGHAGGVIP